MASGRDKNEFVLPSDEYILSGGRWTHHEDVLLCGIQRAFPSSKYSDSRRVYVACVLGMNRNRPDIQKRLQYLTTNKNKIYTEHKSEAGMADVTKEDINDEIELLASNISKKKIDGTLDDWKAVFVKRYPFILTKDEVNIFEAADDGDDEEEEAEFGSIKKRKKQEISAEGNGKRKRKTPVEDGDDSSSSSSSSSPSASSAKSSISSSSNKNAKLPAQLPDICALPPSDTPIEWLSAEELQSVASVDSVGPSTFKPSLYKSRLVHILSKYDVSEARGAAGFTPEDDQVIIQCLVGEEVSSFDEMEKKVPSDLSKHRLRTRTGKLIKDAINKYPKQPIPIAPVRAPPLAPVKIEKPLDTPVSPILGPQIPPAQLQFPASQAPFSADARAAGRKVDVALKALEAIHAGNPFRAMFLQQAKLYMLNAFNRWNVTTEAEGRLVFLMIKSPLEERDDVSAEFQTRIASLELQCLQELR